MEGEQALFSAAAVEAVFLAVEMMVVRSLEGAAVTVAKANPKAHPAVPAICGYWVTRAIGAIWEG